MEVLVEPWQRDKYLSLGDLQSKAAVMANSIYSKLHGKMKQDGRKDAGSSGLLKSICMDVCIDSIKSKGDQPINQVWFQKVEDQVLKNFAHGVNM